MILPFQPYVTTLWKWFQWQSNTKENNNLKLKQIHLKDAYKDNFGKFKFSFSVLNIISSNDQVLSKIALWETCKIPF